MKRLVYRLISLTYLPFPLTQNKEKNKKKMNKRLKTIFQPRLKLNWGDFNNVCACVCVCSCMCIINVFLSSGISTMFICYIYVNYVYLLSPFIYPVVCCCSYLFTWSIVYISCAIPLLICCLLMYLWTLFMKIFIICTLNSISLHPITFCEYIVFNQWQEKQKHWTTK